MAAVRFSERTNFERLEAQFKKMSRARRFVRRKDETATKTLIKL